MDKPSSKQEWEFDFGNWNLEDVLQFEEAVTVREKLPIIAKAVKFNPLGIDLNDRRNYKKIGMPEWKELQAAFTDTLKAYFQPA